jgi:hypothetical protein
VNTWIFYNQIFPIYMSFMCCTYWYHHLSIHIWERESWRCKVSIILYLGLSKGDYIHGPYADYFLGGFQTLGRGSYHKKNARNQKWMSHLDILPHLYPCIKMNLDYLFGILYLQSFVNNLPKIFTHCIISFSFSLCQKEWRYHFQNHSTPNKRGRSMVTREITFTSL